ncbi:hypothetical protein [Enterobacter cloacae complex sp. 301C7]
MIQFYHELWARNLFFRRFHRF